MAHQIRAAESLQVLIRQMQELWLFGQLDTLDGPKSEVEMEGKVREVRELLGRVLEGQKSAVNGSSEVEGGSTEMEGGRMEVVEA